MRSSSVTDDSGGGHTAVGDPGDPRREADFYVVRGADSVMNTTEIAANAAAIAAGQPIP